MSIHLPRGDRKTVNEKMMCDVERICYYFKKRAGQAYLADGHCVDMSGCIDFFKSIDQTVRQIETFAGSKRDTTYVCLPGDNWRAMDPEQLETMLSFRAKARAILSAGAQNERQMSADATDIAPLRPDPYEGK